MTVDQTYQLDDADIGLLARLVDRYLGDTVDGVDDRVDNVRYNLDSAAEILALALVLDNLLVDLAGGDVVIAGKVDTEITLVVAEIQIGLATIVEDETLAVLLGVHGTGINVDVGINLDGSDLEAEGLEEKTA